MVKEICESSEAGLIEISETEGGGPEEPLRDTATLEDVTADNAMTRTPTNYDESQQSTTGQEGGGSDCDLELKDGVDSELPKVTKVSNSLEGLADAGNNGKDTAGYNMRTLAMKADQGSHINLDAAATSKQEQVDDCVGGGDEDGMADWEKLSRRGVVPDGIRIVDPIDYLAPTIIKYERLPQKLVKAGLEMSEPLQDELVKEICESSEAGLNEINETEGDGPEEPLEDTATQDGVTVANDLEEIYDLIQEIFELAKAGIGETENVGPEEMPRNATQKDVTAKDTKGDSPDELLKEPAIEKSAAEKIYETAGGNPKEPFRDTAALEDFTVNDHDLRDAGQVNILQVTLQAPIRRKTRKASELEVCDFYP